VASPRWRRRPSAWPGSSRWPASCLTPVERGVRRDSLTAIARGESELRRLRVLEQDVAWSARPLDDGQTERLRQFAAGRAEITAGDRLVLGTLRARARARQRYWLGVPLMALGTITALVVGRRLRARQELAA
jgi:hypothetical protein